MIDRRHRRIYGGDLPTPRTTLRVLVFCNSCRHQADADLQAIIDGAGQRGWMGNALCCDCQHTVSSTTGGR